jgi:hypothetical protein
MIPSTCVVHHPYRMWWVRILDTLLLGTMILVPWVALVVALIPFWRIIRREWWAIVLLGALVTVFFVSQLHPRQEVLMQAISNTVHEPWLQMYRTSILEHGRAPLWMPIFGTGLPDMANPYMPAMSPLTVLTLLTPAGVSPFTMLLWLHLLLAITGAYLLVRSMGVSIPGAVLAAVVAIFNLWVFRRFQAEIYAAYVIAYSWFPLVWALLLHFLRTRRLLHAAYIGIPLTFMTLTMPTLTVFLSIGMNVLVGIEIIKLLFQRQMRAVGTLIVGMLLMLAVTILLGAPEFLGVYEQAGLAADSNRIVGVISKGPGLPDQGWRTRDFSTAQFLHTLLGRFGERLLPEVEDPSRFGVPYTPANEIVVVALFGLMSALLVRSWRQKTFAVSHLILSLVLANIFVSGALYLLVWYWYPLFTRTGIFPGVGALLVLLITVYTGVGFDAVVRLITGALRWLAAQGVPGLRRIITDPVVTRFSRGALFLVAVGLGIAQMWSPVALWDRVQGKINEKHPLFPSYRMLTMPLAERDRFPHLQLVKQAFSSRPFPVRLFCMSDTSIWPSPCLEDGVLRAGMELVAIGEQSWTPPGHLVRPIEDAMVAWNQGEFSPLLRTIVRLASVDAIVTTRPLPLPQRAKISWTDPPFSSEAYDYFSGSLQKNRGREWSRRYLIELFIHDVPDPLPRVSFGESIPITDSSQADIAVHEVFSQAERDINNVAVIHRAEQGRESDATVLDATTPAGHQELQRRVNVASQSSDIADDALTFSSPAPGEWMVEGTLPRTGTLLFSQVFYPGWRAWVNGAAVPVERANLFMTAIPAPEGKISARLIYAPVKIYLSSLLSLAAAAGLIYWTRRTYQSPRA